MENQHLIYILIPEKSMIDIINIVNNIAQSQFKTQFVPEILPCPKEDLGEYCFQIFSLSKTIRQKPDLVSKIFEECLSQELDYFIKVNSTGGYVNFSLTNSTWMALFKNTKLPEYASRNETIIIDYIGMNVGKPPHIGHICTPLQGQSIINLLSFYGYTIISDSHFGDWGSLFGKLIVGYKKFGDEIRLKDDAIEHLLEVYIKITSEIEVNPLVDQECRDAFRKLSQGDSEYTQYWDSFTKASIATANKMLALMDVYQTYDIGESFYEGLKLPTHGDYPKLEFSMNDIVKELLEKNIATQNIDGSVGIIFPENINLPSTILQKKDGTNLYLTSDLAAIKYRLTNGWNPKKILYFIDVRQQLHFKQVFAIAKMAWPNLLEGVELYHAANGALTLPDGAMSTRKGNIIRLDALAEEGFKRTKEIIDSKGKNLTKQDIDSIAIGAIKYSYLSQDRERDIIFSWDKALTFEGNSGPYIQYAYVRANKILKELEDVPYEYSKYELQLTSYDKNLIKILLTFPNIIEKSVHLYKAHLVAIFSYELATTMNEFYAHTPKIIDEDDYNMRSFRVELIRKAILILEKSCSIIGVKMPTSM